MITKHFNKISFLVILLTVLFSFNTSKVKASHIVGGQIEYKWVSGNVYEVTLNFYRDCVGIAIPTQVNICFYDKVTNSFLKQINIDIDTNFTLVLGDQCYTPPGICVELGVFTDTVTLPNNPNGYYMMYSTSARNSALNNAVAGAMTWYTEMPDPALHNSGPTFINYPKAYFCHSFPNFENLSAIDVDGDSLKYYVETPLAGTGGCAAKPSGGYAPVTYQSGYSASQPLGGTGAAVPVMDTVTGVLTVTPPLGLNNKLIVLAYRVEEWRNGIKIGETRRDMQYKVLTCSPNVPPYFTEEPSYSRYTIAAGELLCYNMSLSDLNGPFGTQAADGVYFTYESVMLNGAEKTPQATITLNPIDSVTAPDTASIRICIQTACEQIRPEPYRIKIFGNDTSCYGINTIEYKLDLWVVPPGLVDLYPNVFTPNGDNKNDKFKTNAQPNYCFDTFEIIIYDRWGHPVFESNNHAFTWDGNNKGGKPMDDGVYYYTIKSSFQEVSNEERGFVHLIS